LSVTLATPPERFYPERSQAPLPLLDRLVGRLGFVLHRVSGGRFSRTASLLAATAEHAVRLGEADARERVPGLRYRLRRDGTGQDLLAECFALYGRAAGRAVSAEAIAAAGRLAAGGVVGLARTEDRHDALGLAAFALALHFEHVHLLAGSAAAARSLAQSLEAPFAALGMQVGCVVEDLQAAERRAAYRSAIVCIAYREAGLDYLRDAKDAGARPGELRATFERLSATPRPLMLPGLHCALVAEADRVMLDDASTPLVISSEADLPGERLVYEQALEFARGLSRPAHFSVDEQGVRLTREASQLLERLVAPLGGVWSAQQHREVLVVRAIEALHLLRRDVDYRVANGRVALASAAEAPDGEDAPRDEALIRLVEIKEGCRLSGRRVVEGRLAVPRFLRKYLHLGGVCADARGLESDLWALYGLKTWHVGAQAPLPGIEPRVFVKRDALHAAVLAWVGEAIEKGEPVTVAVCPDEAVVDLRSALGALDAGAVQVMPLSALRDGSGARGRVLVAGLPAGQASLRRLCREFALPGCELVLCLEDEHTAAWMPASTRWLERFILTGPGELRPLASRWAARQALKARQRAQSVQRAELAAREAMLDDLLAFSGRRD